MVVKDIDNTFTNSAVLNKQAHRTKEEHKDGSDAAGGLH